MDYMKLAKELLDIRIKLVQVPFVQIRQYRAEILPDIRDYLEELGPEDAQAYIRIEQKLWKMHLQKQ